MENFQTLHPPTGFLCYSVSACPAAAHRPRGGTCLRCKGSRGEVGPFPWMSGTDHLHSMRTKCIYKSSRIGNHNLLIENWIQYQFHHHGLQIAGNIAELSVERLCAIVGKVMELWGCWETTRMTIEYHIGRVAKIWVGSILENHSKHSFHDHRSWMRMMHCTDKQNEVQWTKWSLHNSNHERMQTYSHNQSTIQYQKCIDFKNTSEQVWKPFSLDTFFLLHESGWSLP